jgi:hypothetical protein
VHHSGRRRNDTLPVSHSTVLVEAEVKPQQRAGADGNPDVSLIQMRRHRGPPDAFVAAGERDGEQRPFGYYRIS